MDSATSEVVCTMDMKQQVEVIALSLFRSKIQQEIMVLEQQGVNGLEPYERSMLNDYVRSEEIAAELLTGIITRFVGANIH